MNLSKRNFETMCEIPDGDPRGLTKPTSPAEVQEAVQQTACLLPRGGGSKPGLSNPPEHAATLDLGGLSGMQEYLPEEYTFTALAGTPVAEIRALLANHGQYLPCDPPLEQSGATLGGTVAAGLSGPGRYRYGGVRDFILGVRFVTGAGELVCGGGKVVKNAAGFDFPKLFVGSLGRLGVLVELTFKVFPEPRAYATLRVDYSDLSQALGALYRLTTAPVDLEALDLEPPATLCIRLGGLPKVLSNRLDRLRIQLDGGEIVEGPQELLLWENAREFAWVLEDWSLVKVPVTPARILVLEERFAEMAGDRARRRYSAGGNLAWVAWPGDVDAFDNMLTELDLTGLRLLGPSGPTLLGARSGAPFLRRITQALDPDKKFLRL